MSFQDLEKYKIIEYGNFVLKSGEQSDYYVNIKKIISIPDLFHLVTEEIISRIMSLKDLNECCIIGVPYSGIPFASVVAYRLFIPMLMLRRSKKTYGTRQIVEGNTEKKSVILIEDVVTTGGSVRETIKILEDEGFVVKYVVSIFQRNGGVFDDSKFKYINIITRK